MSVDIPKCALCGEPMPVGEEMFKFHGYSGPCPAPTKRERKVLGGEMSAHGWLAVDLDGTLAQYEGWVSDTHIGAPVPRMVARVKQWLAEGKDVRVFTARVSHTENLAEILAAISDWCLKHIGQRLPITNTKDYAMITLWDDRCVQVEPNTGRRVDGRDVADVI